VQTEQANLATDYAF